MVLEWKYSSYYSSGRGPNIFNSDHTKCNSLMKSQSPLPCVDCTPMSDIQMTSKYKSLLLSLILLLVFIFRYLLKKLQ